MSLRECSLLVHAGLLITDPSSSPGILRDAGLCIDNGQIIDVGPYDYLRQRYKPAARAGGPDVVVMPGMINAHDHGRAVSPQQLGIADQLLEIWILELLCMPGLDRYTETALSALQQLRHGVASSTNSYYRPGEFLSDLDAAAAAYRDSGLRCGLIASAMDQSVVEQLLRGVMPSMPRDLQQRCGEMLAARSRFDAEHYFEQMRSACNHYEDSPKWLMTGPVSLHWCSDELLSSIWQFAEQQGMAIQAHALESPYQQWCAEQRYGRSVVAYLQSSGWLNAQLSLAHGVFTTRDDMELLANAGSSIVHNASSNLRLRNGIAPLCEMLDAGVNVALGLDSMALNDDADLFREMRLVANLHRSPSQQLDARQVFSMATINGAKALGKSAELGSLECGKQADFLVLDVSRLPVPRVALDTNIFAQLLHYAGADTIRQVYVAGECVMDDGHHRRLDEASLRDDLYQQLSLFGLRKVATSQASLAEIKPYLADYLAARRGV